MLALQHGLFGPRSSVVKSSSTQHYLRRAEQATTTSAVSPAGKRGSQQKFVGKALGSQTKKHAARSPLKCQAGFENQNVANDATDIPTDTLKTAETDTKDQKVKTSDNFGEELPLESCVNLVSQIISSQCAQPDFVVNSIGMIPGEEGGAPTFAWLATQVDEGAPFGFGTKANREEFWQVPLEIMTQLDPSFEDEEKLRIYKTAMYLKAERANLSDSAVFAFGFMLQSVQLSKAYSLVCGPERSPVKEIYTLLASRPLQGLFSHPLVMMEGGNSLQVPLLGGVVDPETAAQLGTDACLQRTIMVETEAGWYELNLTAPEVDIFTFSAEGNPVYMQAMDAEFIKGAPLSPMDKFVKEWPTKLREMSAETVIAPSASMSLDADVDSFDKKTRVERTFFQALDWAKAAQDQLGIVSKDQKGDPE